MPSCSTSPPWSCKKCTFLNSPSQKSQCQLCSTPFSSSSSGDSKVLHGEIETIASIHCLKIMSYNVWFNEALELHGRMNAIGDIIRLYSPHVIFLQEVTRKIYNIFRNSEWWNAYSCSVSTSSRSRPYFCMQLIKLPVKSFSCKSFENSIMGRELCIAEVEVPGHKPLVVATSHLESACPAPPSWDQMFSQERVEQATESLKILGPKPNVIFGGDMNWNDKLDGKFPLPDKWVDAWEVLKPGDPGFTLDTESNPMISGEKVFRERLDRFLCRLDDYKVSGIEVIGKEAISGGKYVTEKKVGDGMKMELPVLPSDHFGLILTILPKGDEPNQTGPENGPNQTRSETQAPRFLGCCFGGISIS